ncbi:hypothetical protein ACI2LJ_32730 [Streptomyces sp. NPDC088090]
MRPQTDHLESPARQETAVPKTDAEPAADSRPTRHPPRPLH